MTAAAKDASIKTASGDTVGVRGSDGQVHVQWVTSCATRRFTPERLREVVDRLELAGSYGDDVWLYDRDSDDMAFYARVFDGRAQADETPNTDAPHVSWSMLKRALVARAK